MSALEGTGQNRGPRERSGKAVAGGFAKAVRGGYCRLQVPLKAAVGVRERERERERERG